MSGILNHHTHFDACSWSSTNDSVYLLFCLLPYKTLPSGLIICGLKNKQTKKTPHSKTHQALPFPCLPPANTNQETLFFFFSSFTDVPFSLTLLYMSCQQQKSPWDSASPPFSTIYFLYRHILSFHRSPIPSSQSLIFLPSHSLCHPNPLLLQVASQVQAAFNH